MPESVSPGATFISVTASSGSAGEGGSPALPASTLVGATSVSGTFPATLPSSSVAFRFVAFAFATTPSPASVRIPLAVDGAADAAAVDGVVSRAARSGPSSVR